MKGMGKRWLEIWLTATKLGLTSFGGPVAHLGYFHEEYVKRRKWLDERSYAELVALCHFLPGPASSQVGMGIGILRGGLLGGILSFIGFTMPSAIVLIIFALLLQHMDLANSGWLHGLKLVAVAIVAQAIWGMGQKLAPDRARKTIVILTSAAALLWQTTFSQVTIILLAGCAGIWLYRNQKFDLAVSSSDNISVAGGQLEQSKKSKEHQMALAKWIAVCSLIAFACLFLILPILSSTSLSNFSLSLFDSFYRSGSLVFGGGHVVLPLLEHEVIPNGWVSEEQFLAGYGMTQAMPGPLFTFAAYLGATASGWSGAAIATIAIFLPAYLLIAGTLPFWSILRMMPRVQRALLGVNAAIVGVLLAAFYDPIWTSSVQSSQDFVLALCLFVMLTVWKLPPWAVVVTGAAAGQFISWFS